MRSASISFVYLTVSVGRQGNVSSIMFKWDHGPSRLADGRNIDYVGPRSELTDWQWDH